MAKAIDQYTFSVRKDDFSVRISCKEDARFWFRVEPMAIPNITDFYLGGFPEETGPLLFRKCFEMLRETLGISNPVMDHLTKPPVVIFKNLYTEQQAG